MAQFGLKYYAQMRSKFKGVFWRVEIAERDYSRASEEMEFSGNNPLQSLWSILSSCITLLELDVSISDWMDLYAEGTSESQSPLRQVYVDMERFYYVYEEPTFRDALELCLRPFAGQIFQSGGSLHIRRAISLNAIPKPLSARRLGG